MNDNFSRRLRARLRHFMMVKIACVTPYAAAHASAQAPRKIVVHRESG
jgi:hypothetical protein